MAAGLNILVASEYPEPITSHYIRRRELRRLILIDAVPIPTPVESQTGHVRPRKTTSTDDPLI